MPNASHIFWAKAFIIPFVFDHLFYALEVFFSREAIDLKLPSFHLPNLVDIVTNQLEHLNPTFKVPIPKDNPTWADINYHPLI